MKKIPNIRMIFGVPHETGFKYVVKIVVISNRKDKLQPFAEAITQDRLPVEFCLYSDSDDVIFCNDSERIVLPEVALIVHIPEGSSSQAATYLYEEGEILPTITAFSNRTLVIDNVNVRQLFEENYDNFQTMYPLFFRKLLRPEAEPLEAFDEDPAGYCI